MKFTKTILFFGLTLSTLFISCEKPIIKNSSVTVTNTFQSTAFTGGTELAIEALFKAPAGSLAATANVNDDVEFPNYLIGLYNIDLDRKKIKFEVAAKTGDSTYGSLFRILEAGTTDRYYFTFAEAQNVNNFKSDNPSVKLRIDSDKILVVEIGEGYDFKPGQSFTITLK
jgi:hypothetical protein